MSIMPLGLLDAQVDPARPLNTRIINHLADERGRNGVFSFFLQEVLDFENSSLAALGSGSAI